MTEIKNTSLENRREKERAATFVEYILLVVLIALAAVVVLRVFGQTASQAFSKINSAISGT